MKLCLNTSTIQPQPLLDKIQITAEAGFVGIELWVNDIYQYIGQGGEVRDIENALEDHALELPCMIAVRGW
jgi:sugar phosphate isomerase/epimerase